MEAGNIKITHDRNCLTLKAKDENHYLVWIAYDWCLELWLMYASRMTKYKISSWSKLHIRCTKDLPQGGRWKGKGNPNRMIIRCARWSLCGVPSSVKTKANAAGWSLLQWSITFHILKYETRQTAVQVIQTPTVVIMRNRTFRWRR